MFNDINWIVCSEIVHVYILNAKILIIIGSNIGFYVKNARLHKSEAGHHIFYRYLLDFHSHFLSGVLYSFCDTVGNPYFKRLAFTHPRILSLSRPDGKCSVMIVPL